ncbi:MAG TPA: flagellar FlbD family protein [Candidatus Scybalomonas excrementigallinarum]|nr:flagellar FlbD family protein [Candidatus Scybalomonas excrementigallinarum]
MIKLTKLNNAEIVLNEEQIEYIEIIPESKVIMMNGKFHIVKESADEIIQRVIAFQKEIRPFEEKIKRKE